MENGLSASDVALMSRNDGYGYGLNGGGEWIFGLLVLMGIMNGGFGGWGNDRNYATTQDVNNAQQFGQILDGNRDIMSQANNNANSLLNAITQAEYENVAVVKDAQLQLQDRLSDLHAGQKETLSAINECCCNTRLEIANQAAGIGQGIMQNRYENALNTAAINDVTVAQTQKILDTITGNRMADMQNQIYQLQLAQATNGMLKFPNTWAYGAGPFPPFPLQPSVAV